METINYRPRLLREDDRPKLFHVDIRVVDNGYIATFSFHGGMKTLITTSLTDISSWLTEWDNYRVNEDSEA